MASAVPVTEVMPGVVPYSATRFEAFRIVEATKPAFGCSPPRTTYALGDIPATSLDEALNATLVKCLILHKEHLAIRETDERGARVHLYAIKQRSMPDYVWEGHVQKRVNRLYAAPLCTIDGSVFE